jgi:hypothetical protein
VAALHGVHSETRQQAYRVLQMTIWTAKQSWFEDLLKDPDVLIWDLAKWQHGRRAWSLLPIQDGSGLTMDGEQMAVAFHTRFFPNERALPAPTLDLPFPPHPQRPFQPILQEEVTAALQRCSNKSSPGPSKTPYPLIRWLNEADPDLLPSLFTTTLHLGAHPWPVAKVVVIPKLGKTDYSLPHTYRPISLLECVGKVLEKVVVARLGVDVDAHSLISPSQFGSRHFHSAPDAAAMLRYKAESTIRAGQIGMVVLLDISCFFDSLDPSLMEQILLHLGVDTCTATWTQSLMVDREVTLHVNGFISEGFKLGWGTPQGSLASPIISTLFTSPLLHTTQCWEHANFSLYVDDGAVFASSPTFDSAATHAAQGVNDILQWLHQLGLTVDGEKMEAMFFHPAKPSIKHLRVQPHGLTLWDGVGDPIHVTPSMSLRYLGVFFTPQLSWSLHVKTLATCARSTVRALGVLGNSVHGFSLLRWWRIFLAVIVLVLTYGV